MAEIMSLSLRCIKLQAARLCIHHHTTQCTHAGAAINWTIIFWMMYHVIAVLDD